MRDNYILLVILLFSGAVNCDRTVDELIVYNSTWPDGTCVSILAGREQFTRTIMYGGHARLGIPKHGSYFVRTASPAFLTFLSDTLTVTGRKNSFTLPAPLSRRRIGSWHVGLALNINSPDSLYNYLLSNAHGSLTTISPELLCNYHLINIIRMAHEKGIEVTATVPLQARGLTDIFSLADSAEVYCVDGIVVVPDSTVLKMAEFSDIVQEFAAELHRRGLTLAVQIKVDCGAATLSLFPELKYIMTNTPYPERPDELRIAFKCNGIPSSVSAERIEEIISELFKEHIPLSRISAELYLTAFKFQVMDDGDLEQVSLRQGELASLINTTGGYGAIRLRDGSLRFGYTGFLYVYEDSEGFSEKIRLLRSGIFSRSSGIYIVYDGCGVEANAEGIKQIARSVKSP